MRKKTYATIIATACGLALAVAASIASANKLSTNEQRFRLTWVELNLTDPIFGIGVHCPVTLEGSLHSSVSQKVAGALGGFVTRVSVGNESCTGGHVSVLAETLPWHLTYKGFRGTLPRIEALLVTLHEVSFRIETAVITCLARAAALTGELRGRIEASGAFKPESDTPSSESIPCREAGGSSIEGVFSGTGTVTKLGSTERILVTLI